jgi:hypothetical protein
MPDPTHLIRRDLPLEPGRKLVFSFTVSYEVPLDENCLDYVPYDPNDGPSDALAPTSLDELEKFYGDTHRSSESIWSALAGNYDRTIVEHEVRLDDRYEGADVGEVRFESTWEAKEREQGTQSTWSSRVWLDEVPSAGALPLGPESNPPVGAVTWTWDGTQWRDANGNPAPKVDLNDGFWTAEEVMSKDG